MKIRLNRIILFVRDVDALTTFYRKNLNLTLVERIKGEWAVLRAGSAELALHRIGKAYRPPEGEPSRVDTNVKLVFEVDRDVAVLRYKLLEKNVRMRDLKLFNDPGYVTCDGEDTEGNVFQLKQKKKLKSRRQK